MYLTDWMQVGSLIAYLQSAIQVATHGQLDGKFLDPALIIIL